MNVPKLPSHLLFNKDNTQKENWQDIISRIHQACDIQLERQDKLNSFLSNKEIQQFCCLDKQTQKYFSDVLDKLNISARAFHRILKVARTIADLEQSSNITQTHLSEAMSYRQLDRLLKP